MIKQLRLGRNKLNSAYWSLVGIASAMIFSMQPVMAATIWDRFSAIMQDIYGQIVAISTIVAVTVGAIALIIRMVSRNQRAVDEATQWLKRIVITWIILNSLGFIVAYLQPLIAGGNYSPGGGGGGGIMAYFENSVQDIPKYWEDSPKEAMDYPHAPWWNYAPCTVFNPNPCAVVASAMIRYGTDSQKKLGYKIAEDCFKLLLSDDFCGDHDSLNIQALVEQLLQINSPLISDEIMASMRRRILDNTCFDASKYRR